MQYFENDGLSRKEKLLDVWRNIYCWAIPTTISIIYAAIYCLIKFNIINWYTLTDSKNIGQALEAIITFISIVISLFGILLPILISAKDTSKMITWFLESIDRKYFINCIKKVFLSGFITIFLSCTMFFNDIFYDCISFLLTLLLIWNLSYFMASSYRFTGILLALLIENKESGHKQVKK